MNMLRTIGSELLGLFVDDWAFALLLVGWVALIGALHKHLPAALPGPLLFIGLAALTLVFALRRAKKAGG